GAAGLRAIRSRGGIGIIQSPDDAFAREMPASALEYGGADYVLTASDIGPRIVELVSQRENPSMRPKKANKRSKKNRCSQGDAEENLHTAKPGEGCGVPSPFSCPECGGVLWEGKNGKPPNFRCRVGHAYGIASLAAEHKIRVEDALWAAMRALEEKAALATRISQSSTDSRSRERLQEQAQADRAYAETVREIIFTEENNAKSPD